MVDSTRSTDGATAQAQGTKCVLQQAQLLHTPHMVIKFDEVLEQGVLEQAQGTSEATQEGAKVVRETPDLMPAQGTNVVLAQAQGTYGALQRAEPTFAPHTVGALLTVQDGCTHGVPGQAQSNIMETVLSGSMDDNHVSPKISLGTPKHVCDDVIS